MKITGIVNCNQCRYCKNNSCSNSNLNIQLDYSKFGTSIAKRCSEFSIRRQQYSKIKLTEALDVILSGNKEFIMISGNTGRRLRYLVEKKTTPLDNEGQTSDIYWVHCEGTSGVLEYAGTVYKDKIDDTYKFSQGKRGKFSKYSLEIRSILFVLNKLHKEVYNIPLTIEDPNEYEIENEVD